MRASTIAAAILIASIGTAHAQIGRQSSAATLTVQGQGRVQVPPDHATLSVEVITKGKTPDAATAAHRERASRAVTALRELANDGLKIESSVFRLNEIRPQPPERRETEYQAVTQFELKLTDVSKVDANVTAIASSGLFEVRGMGFGIEEKNPGLNAARKNAVDDARERAETYAAAASVQLGAIMEIDDSEGRTPRQFATAAPMMRGVQVIPPEQLALSASVRITWQINAVP